jgi:hypothetical protein
VGKVEVGIGSGLGLFGFSVFGFEHKCSFAKILADKDAHSQSPLIEITHRKAAKGIFSNILMRDRARERRCMCDRLREQARSHRGLSRSQKTVGTIEHCGSGGSTIRLAREGVSQGAEDNGC